VTTVTDKKKSIMQIDGLKEFYTPIQQNFVFLSNPGGK